MSTTKQNQLSANRSTIAWIISVFIMASPARAAGCAKQTRVIEAELAAGLAYVLRELPQSGKQLSHNSILISMAAIRCQKYSRDLFPDEMPVFRCSEPAAVDGLTAKLLWDSLAQLNIDAESSMGRSLRQASDIRCTIEQQSNDPRHSPRCVVTAVWTDSCQ